MSRSHESIAVIRIPPFEYIHVLDTNTNVTAVLTGPKTYTRQDHERVTKGPDAMICVPPRHYCVISDPVQRDADGNVLKNEFGIVKLRYGDAEVRLSDKYPDPFPLFPGEALAGAVKELEVIPVNTALYLQALRDFDDRKAGDEWLFAGPGTYVPRIEVKRLKKVSAKVITHDMGLRLRARRETTDSEGKPRKAGEEWMVRSLGAYMPGVCEEIVETVRAYVLTEKKALHIRAERSFTDVYGKERKAGEEWLVTFDLAETHIKDVSEVVVGEVDIVTLTNRQYCVIVDPYVDGTQSLGTKVLRRGECSFFLQPGETLENEIEQVHVLAEDEGLLLTAHEAFTDESPVAILSHGEGKVEGSQQRRPGDLWMIYGPCEYVPSVEVEIVERRRAIPLNDNEGIYIRDIKSGKVRAVIGATYMLKPTEVLWDKPLAKDVEALLIKQSLGQAYIAPEERGRRNAPQKVSRNKSKVVTFQVPHNAACQVYDYKRKTARVGFGPDLIMLMPDEQFTMIRLSGDKPKRPNVISSLCLMMGPDFMTDIITVETSDHARLQLTLSYNWHFEVDRADPEATAKMFSVRDFTGDACKAMASRVRGAVAGETFDNFHKYSAKIIRGSIFGMDEAGKVRDKFVFPNNNLIITNVDVQSVEPVDSRTRESLQKSVQLAIEITTNSQEAKAHQEAKREEEEAKGMLEQQRLKNQAQAEETRKLLLKLQADSNAVEAEGQATADAKAKAAAAEIEAQASIRMAKAKAEAMQIEAKQRLEMAKAEQAAEVEHQQALMNLEIEKAQKLAEIEAAKFKQTVDAIGSDTIASIARAGPEMQAKLLQGLGLKGFLVTDGKNPINLFQTASGMVAGPARPPTVQEPDMGF